MSDFYDYNTLMCRLKISLSRNKALESGERYIQLEELHQKEYRAYEQKILKLQDQLTAAHKETIRVRNYWLQVLEDMQFELEKYRKRQIRNSEKWKRALYAQKSKEMMF